MSIEENDDRTEDQSVQLEPMYYLGVVATVVLVLLSLLLLRSLTGGLLAKYHIYNADYFIIAMLFYVSMSWRAVPAGYAGGISTFGIPSWEVNAGWYFVPLFFCKLGMFPMKEEEEQFPADPELINKGPDTEPLREGEFRPIRTNTGPGKQDSDDILDARGAPEWTFSVRWAIRKKSFFEIDTRLKGDTWEEKHYFLRRTMRDTGEGLLSRESGSRSPVEIISDLEVIDEKLKSALQKAFNKFDIDIVEVRLQTPDFGTGVNHALSNVIEERAKATAVEVAAKGEKTRQILVSEGAKSAVINASEGEAIALANVGKGLKDKAEALGMSGSELLAMQMMPDVFGDKVVIFGQGGMQELATGIKAVTDAMKSTESKKKGDDKS